MDPWLVLRWCVSAVDLYCIWKTEVLRRNLSHCHIVQDESQMAWPGLKQRLLRWKVHKRSHSTFHLLFVLAVVNCRRTIFVLGFRRKHCCWQTTTEKCQSNAKEMSCCGSLFSWCFQHIMPEVLPPLSRLQNCLVPWLLLTRHWAFKIRSFGP